MALQKLVCNLDETLMREVDAYGETLHITRTAAVAVLLSRALQAEKLAGTLTQMMDAYNTEKAKQEVVGNGNSR